MTASPPEFRLARHLINAGCGLSILGILIYGIGGTPNAITRLVISGILGAVCFAIADVGVKWIKSREKLYQENTNTLNDVDIFLSKSSNDLSDTETDVIFRETYDGTIDLFRARYLRISILARKGGRDKLSSYIISVVRIKDNLEYEEIKLPHPLAIKENFDILSGIECVLDVFIFDGYRNNIEPAGYRPNTWPRNFDNGIYDFVIAISSGNDTKKFTVRIIWGGHFDNMKIIDFKCIR